MPPPSRQHRTKSPLRAQSPEVACAELTPVFSESKLVLAIQTLDSIWKTTKRSSGSQEETEPCHRASPLSDLFREALCTLLEIAASFDKPDLVNKSQLETVCTARVLGCFKRFVAGCAGMQPPLGACCDRKCEQRLIHLALLSILFRMCREPVIAPNVVKEGLYNFLIRMCTPSEMPNSDSVNLTPDEAFNTQDKVAFDPQDLMVTIDPFDWCYQPLCTRLLKENTHAFFIPMGIRSLICILRGIAIPTDEVSEFEQQIRGTREKNLKRRKLPSIFAFPLNEDGVEFAKEDPVSIRACQHKLAPLCYDSVAKHREQREIRGLWSLVLDDNSRIHLALRSLVALGVHLPRPSPEYRSLLRERDYIRRVLRTYDSLLPKKHKLENVLFWLNSSDNDSSHVELLPFQQIATQRITLKRIASSALSVFSEKESTKREETISKQHISTGGRRVLNPINEKPDFTRKPKKRRDCEPLSIQQRLTAASETAHSELTRWENRRLLQHRASELERNRQRLAVQKLCVDVENLRSHLVRSLEVLCSGRQHPNPHQPFSEWIKSLPTLETFERERQYQQEMRQRQILEQQYQREAQRRRERDECVLMQANDYNIPEENEVSKQQQKHQHFLRMQAEMRQLEQRDSDGDTLKPTTETNVARTPTKTEKLVNQERQRLLQLEDQRREGRELEKMRREDLYYVERILQAKAKEKEEQETRAKSGYRQKNAIEQQQKHIVRMRLLNEEKHLNERETSGMRLEDLLGRQMRYREAEKAKETLHNEWRERKTMQAEEHDSRSRWTLWERALIQQQQEELKQQRAEARRLKRQQQREEKEIRAAWVESWDENGNMYYYNPITGVSQWEAFLERC